MSSHIYHIHSFIDTTVYSLSGRSPLWPIQCSSVIQSGSSHRCNAYQWIPSHARGSWSCVVHRPISSIEKLTTSSTISLSTVPVEGDYLSIVDLTVTRASADIATKTITTEEILDGVKSLGLRATRKELSLTPHISNSVIGKKDNPQRSVIAFVILLQSIFITDHHPLTAHLQNWRRSLQRMNL